MAAKKRWVVVATIALDSGIEYESDVRVKHPTRTYEARVLGWGAIDRSIPAPTGLPQVSDAKIRIADPDRKFRDLLSHQTPRRREVVLKLMQEGSSEAATDPIYVGEIMDAEFVPGAVEIALRDKTFAWIDEPIPAMITKQNFPYIADSAEGGFLPIIVGNMRSGYINPQGVIQLPHMGWLSDTGDRYALAAHPVWDVVALYRKAIDSSGVPERWAVIDPGEYNVVVEPTLIYGLTLHPTFIDFIVEQPQGTEIRADVDGYDFRGEFGSLPTLTGAMIGGPLRNPIDFLISMAYFVLAKAGLETAWNLPALDALWHKFEALGIKCDGVITKTLTAREWLAQFLASFNLDLYINRHGLLTPNFTDESDPDRPVFSEGRLILKQTFKEKLPQPAINQVQFRYQYNSALDNWGTWGLADNVDDQRILGKAVLDSSGEPETDSTGELIRETRVEKEVFDMFYVRDPATAEYIVSKRLAFLSLGSFRQEWQMPAPPVKDQVELAKLVSLTHGQGLELGGYVNREVKLIGLTLDLDKLVYTCRGILRVPQTIRIPLLDAGLPDICAFRRHLQMDNLTNPSGPDLTEFSVAAAGISEGSSQIGALELLGTVQGIDFLMYCQFESVQAGFPDGIQAMRVKRAGDGTFLEREQVVSKTMPVTDAAQIAQMKYSGSNVGSVDPVDVKQCWRHWAGGVLCAEGAPTVGGPGQPAGFESYGQPETVLLEDGDLFLLEDGDPLLTEGEPPLSPGVEFISTGPMIHSRYILAYEEGDNGDTRRLVIRTDSEILSGYYTVNLAALGDERVISLASHLEAGGTLRLRAYIGGPSDLLNFAAVLAGTPVLEVTGVPRNAGRIGIWSGMGERYCPTKPLFTPTDFLDDFERSPRDDMGA